MHCAKCFFYETDVGDEVCDRCGRPLRDRSDDRKVEAVRNRLALYHREIDPVVRYYDWKGVLRRVAADAPVREVFGRILPAVDAPAWVRLSAWRFLYHPAPCNTGARGWMITSSPSRRRRAEYLCRIRTGSN